MKYSHEEIVDVWREKCPPYGEVSISGFWLEGPDEAPEFVIEFIPKGSTDGTSFSMTVASFLKCFTPLAEGMTEDE